MPSPLHIKIVGKTELQIQILALNLVHNRPVVDTLNRNPPTIFLVEKLAPFFLHICDVHGGNAKSFFGQKKVRQRLLFQRIDFHQNNLLRIASTHDCMRQQSLVRPCVQSTQEILQIVIQLEDIQVSLRQHRLVRIQRREGLQLHQLRLQFASSVANKSEVHLNEHRIAGLVRSMERSRNCLVGNLSIGRAIGELVNQLAARLRHAVEQCLREETRCFAKAEVYRRTATPRHFLFKQAIFFRSKASVKVLAKGWNHGRSSIAQLARTRTPLPPLNPTTLPAETALAA